MYNYTNNQHHPRGGKSRNQPKVLNTRYLTSEVNHTAEFVNNCEAVAKNVAVNYNNWGPYMAITNNKVEKPIIPIPDAQDKLTTKVKIFIWESCRRIGISDRKYEQSVQDA